MKKISILSLLSLLAGLLVSCETYLDKSPDLGLDDEDIFSNYYTTRGYLDKVYICLQDYLEPNSQHMQRDHISIMSDESVSSTTWTSFYKFFTGEWKGQNAGDVGWQTSGSTNGNAKAGTITGFVIPNAFYALRICNKIATVVPTLEHLSDDEKRTLLGQAYFLRAWHYFELIRRLGGLPIFDQVFTPDSEMDLPRESYQQSTDWILSQLNLAKDMLPDRWDAANMGRPTKASALALKSMAQLYAASPLMQNPVNKVNHKTEYDKDRATLAAQYAKECLEYVQSTGQAMMSKAEYKNIFYHSPNFVSQESLWYLNSTGKNRAFSMRTFFQTTYSSGDSGNVGTANISPTQNIVNKFETINGYPCELTKTGWQCDDPHFDENHPFENRDPRLTDFILLPGEKYGKKSNTDIYLATWENGRDLSNSKPAGRVLTRYLLKKWLWESANCGDGGSTEYGRYYYNSIYIRTTQVWLDYAEALNEAYGPTLIADGHHYSAVTALDEVRARVGMPSITEPTCYQPTEEYVRERIRNERAVELLYENHRWFDIRRWMIAEEIFSEQYALKGARVTASDATSEAPNAGNQFTYELLDITERVRIFDKKHYWYPIPSDEERRMEHFKQSPGW